ncbi:choice-of-anchor L domain-containing protein [Nostoc sp.]|uniref:choice-of-anchor L domain-containing protein n=1 Tax=Nostoc sp. TaxID=1180 RepID=UPI002FFBDD9F
MKFLRQIIPSLVFSLSASLGLVNAPVMAFTVTQNNNPNALLNGLLGSDPNNYKGLSNFNINLIGDARAFGTFSDDPFGLGSAIALSTGRVTDLAGANTIDGGFTPNGADLSTDLGLPGVSGDSISMVLSFDVNNTAEKLFFQYAFGSEELLEYAGQFNDSFSLLLNGVNYATLSNGDSVTINNLAVNPLGPYSSDLIYNPVGTGPASSVTKLDGYTKPLLYNAPLVEGARNFLIINVQDARDGQFDSAVFLKAGTLGSVCPEGADCQPSTPIPEPDLSHVSLLAVVFIFIGLVRKHN